MLDCLTEEEYDQTDRRFDRHYYQTHDGYVIRRLDLLYFKIQVISNLISSGELVDRGEYGAYVWGYDKKVAFSFHSTVAVLAKQVAFKYFLRVLHNVSVECLHIIIVSFILAKYCKL